MEDNRRSNSQLLNFLVRIQVVGWGNRDGWDVPLPDLAIRALRKNSMTERPWRRQVCMTLSRYAV